MLGLPLLLNNVSVFTSQILKHRKIVVELLGILILFAAIQLILMVLIEQVFCDASKDIESILWEHEKYWQCQLFTNMHGMNSISDLCSRSRQGC